MEKQKILGVTLYDNDRHRFFHNRWANDKVVDVLLEYIFQEMDGKLLKYEVAKVDACVFSRDSLKSHPDRAFVDAIKRHLKKDFIVVPYGTGQHWFVGIICFPDETPGETCKEIITIILCS